MVKAKRKSYILTALNLTKGYKHNFNFSLIKKEHLNLLILIFVEFCNDVTVSIAPKFFKKIRSESSKIRFCLTGRL